MTAKETDKKISRFLIASLMTLVTLDSVLTSYTFGNIYVAFASFKNDWWQQQKADLDLDQLILIFFSTDHSKLHVSGWLNFREIS